MNKTKAAGRTRAAGPRHLRAFPKGRRREMTDIWKAEVAAAMTKQSPPMTVQQLATQLGVTRGIVYRLLTPIRDGGQSSSALVPRVCEILHVGPPTEETRRPTPQRQRLDDLIDEMTDEQMNGAIAFLESLLRK